MEQKMIFENTKSVNAVTDAYRTKSEIMEGIEVPKVVMPAGQRPASIVALDIGYSAVKGISAQRAFRFPSYAKRLANGEAEIIGKLKPTDLILKDNKTGELWLVGDIAQQQMTREDVDSTTDKDMYQRFRYETPVFKIVAAASMALALLGADLNDEIFLETGLPSQYKNADTPKLIKALSGEYDVSLKAGNGKFIPFKFTLDEKHINVIEQPQGTLFSAAYQQDGKPIDGFELFLGSKTIIWDFGFNTEDIFAMSGGIAMPGGKAHKTFIDTSMRAVFENAIANIQADYPTMECKVFEFQQFLETGKAMYFDVDSWEDITFDIQDYIVNSNRELCEKSLVRLLQEYDNLKGIDNIIVTGGTGESRIDQIREKLQKMHVKVIDGNINNPALPFAYSNAIGYYMYGHARIERLAKKQAKAAQK